MSARVNPTLIQFLESELAIPADAIALACRRATQFPDQLPMILWHYGLINREQLARIFDWLEFA